MTAPRLTPKMRELLAELAANHASGAGEGGLYIRQRSRWGSTAAALRTRGLARMDAPDHLRLGGDHWAITDAGLQLEQARTSTLPLNGA